MTARLSNCILMVRRVRMTGGASAFGFKEARLVCHNEEFGGVEAGTVRRLYRNAGAGVGAVWLHL